MMTSDVRPCCSANQGANHTFGDMKFIRRCLLGCPGRDHLPDERDFVFGKFSGVMRRSETLRGRNKPPLSSRVGHVGARKTRVLHRRSGALRTRASIERETLSGVSGRISRRAYRRPH
jgi:hypothetical protein